MTGVAITGFPAPDGLWKVFETGLVARVDVGGGQRAAILSVEARRPDMFVGEAEMDNARYGNEAPTLEAAQAEALDAGRSLAADALLAQFTSPADAQAWLALHIARKGA